MTTITDAVRDVQRKAHALIRQIETEDRGPTAEEETQLAAWEKEFTELQGKRAARDRTAATLARMTEPLGPGPAAAAARGTLLPPIPETAAFGLEAAHALGALHVPRVGTWSTPVVELKAVLLEPTGGVSGCTIPPPPIPAGMAPTLARWIPSGAIDGGMVPYLREDTARTTDAAAPVAPGALKPEATIALTPVNAPLIKIAHFVPVEDQFLDDMAGMRAYLDARLAVGVLNRLEDELLNGPGTAGRMMGFLPLPGKAPDVAATGSPWAGAILEQIGAVEAGSGEVVDAIVMNPVTWAAVVADTSTSGGFYMCCTAVQSGVAPSLWGKAVLLSRYIAAGTVLVGAFRTASFLFTKGGVSVQASNAHADFFAKNLTAIRAEIRAALVVWRPWAFGLVTAVTP